MEKVLILIHLYYGHTWYYPYMSDNFKQALEDAFQKDQEAILINRQELETMMGKFLLRISN